MVALAVVWFSVGVTFADWYTSDYINSINITGTSSASYPPGRSQQGASYSSAASTIDYIYVHNMGKQNCDGTVHTAWDTGWLYNPNSTNVQASGSAGSVCTGNSYHYYFTSGEHQWWVGSTGKSGTSCASVAGTGC